MASAPPSEVAVEQPEAAVAAMQPATPAGCASEPFGWRTNVATDPAVAEATYTCEPSGETTSADAPSRARAAAQPSSAVDARQPAPRLSCWIRPLPGAMLNAVIAAGVAAAT